MMTGRQSPQEGVERLTRSLQDITDSTAILETSVGHHDFFQPVEICRGVSGYPEEVSQIIRCLPIANRSLKKLQDELVRVAIVLKSRASGNVALGLLHSLCKRSSQDSCIK